MIMINIFTKKWSPKKQVYTVTLLQCLELANDHRGLPGEGVGRWLMWERKG